MEKKEFLARMFVVFEDRGLKEPKEFWINELWRNINEIPSDSINKGFNRIMNISSAEWNKTYGFGGKPAISDWIVFFSGKKKLTQDQIASAECEKIMQSAKNGWSSGKFDNKTTQKVVNSFARGIKTIHFEVFDTYNPDPKDRNWYKKDLVSKWQDLDNMADLKTPALLDDKVKALLPNIKLNK